MVVNLSIAEVKLKSLGYDKSSSEPVAYDRHSQADRIFYIDVCAAGYHLCLSYHRNILFQTKAVPIESLAFVLPNANLVLQT